MFTLSHLQQILKPVQNGVFQKFVDEHRADKYSKKFRCHDLLVGLVYGQLSQSTSLRVLEARFNSHPEQLYHLNTQALSRSTLADAMKSRNTAPFVQLIEALMRHCQRSLRRDAKELLYLLDSTGIILKGHGFEAFEGQDSGRINGLKLHLMIDAHGGIPVEQHITSAKISDIKAGRDFHIDTGVTYAFDKGYCDYAWWAKINEAGSFFVTRQKKNAAFKVISSNTPSETHILSDELIVFPKPTKSRAANYPHPLRRIVVSRPDKLPLTIISNLLDASASEIAETYKARWQIELLFKWLKQHLKIKTFLGRNENAVKLQILCALIAFLLLKLYHQRAPQTAADTLWIFMAGTSANLFQRPATERACHKRRQAHRAELAARQAALF